MKKVVFIRARVVKKTEFQLSPRESPSKVIKGVFDPRLSTLSVFSRFLPLPAFFQLP